MHATLDECFVVIVRNENVRAGHPECSERELVSCPSYEEAQWIKRECSGPHRHCVIRYVGPSGGGD